MRLAVLLSTNSSAARRLSEIGPQPLQRLQRVRAGHGDPVKGHAVAGTVLLEAHHVAQGAVERFGFVVDGGFHGSGPGCWMQPMVPRGAPRVNGRVRRGG
jgi:hypothetical protein